MKKKTGFTLIELLVVISIIALLLSILLPSLRVAKEQAKRVVCSSQLKGIGTGYFAYAAGNNDNLPTSFYQMHGDNDGFFFAQITGHSSPYRAYRVFDVDPSAPQDAKYPEHVMLWDWGSLEGTKRMWGLGLLFDSGIVENPEAFYCPSTPRASGVNQHSYDEYSTGHTWPWHGTSDRWDGGMTVMSSYYYIPQSPNKSYELVSEGVTVDAPRMARKTSELSGRLVITLDQMKQSFFAHQTGSKKRGVNAMFGDGHVAFANDGEVFRHPIFDNDNVNAYPSVFRAIIKGIEGKTEYMDQVPDSFSR